MTRAHYLFGWGYVAICGALLLGARQHGPANSSHTTYEPATNGGGEAAEIWWRRVRPYCNAVEVRVVQKQMAPPATTAGAGYHAACFALAGQIDEARRIIDSLEPNERYRAAGATNPVLTAIWGTEFEPTLRAAAPVAVATP